MSHWAKVRSFGCFVYFDREVPTRALLETLINGLDLFAEAKMSTKNYFLRWRKFNWKAVDEAVADTDKLSIAFHVGTVSDVRLGGKIWMRNDPNFSRHASDPLLAWVGAESQRWPEPVFTNVARQWLHVAAQQGSPFSGGVLAASELRNAKVEMSLEYETFDGDERNKSQATFRERLRGDHLPDKSEKIRRVYPINLLGPKLASQVDESQLATAGATNIERVNGSLLFDSSPQVLEAWSQEYLKNTVDLRRLLWPLSFQNPADGSGVRQKSG